MRLRQILLALSLVPAMHMSVSAQGVYSDWDETGNISSQSFLVETASAPGPASPTTTERASNSELPKLAMPATVPTPLGIAFQNSMHAGSYTDAYEILKEENTCSRFFGGASKATEVLNSLAEQFRKKRLENPNVAVEMSGAVVLIRDNRTGASYRRFERVLVNSTGPLYLSPLQARANRRAIGRFPSDTRAARALILLHEVGHLVQRSDGQWLLPNDGHDATLSVRNTETVESFCLKQLTSLKH